MTRKIKILIVIGQLELGGTENHILKVLPKLNDTMFTPIVYTLKGGGVLEQPLRDQGVEVICAPTSNNVFGLFEIVRHLRKTLKNVRADILHFFLPQAYMIGMFCSLNIETVVRVMSRRSLNNYQKKHPILKHMEYIFHRHLDFALGNSAKVTQQLAQENISQNLIGLIYNGIVIPPLVTDEVKQAARYRLNIPSDAIVMVVVANLIPYKGHADLIEALGIIVDELPDNWTLICVGRDDGYKPDLIEMSLRNGIQNHVLWVGQALNASEYTEAADIGVLPSHQEGFSNSLLEGMAACLPMIVTDVGGNSEAVIDGETGIIVEPMNALQLSNAILKLVHDKDTIKRYGENGRKRVEKMFNLDRCVKEYDEFYKDICKSSKNLIN